MNRTILITGTAGMLALSALTHAAGRDAYPEQAPDNGQRLEQRLGPDERARMHRELNDDLGKSYPDRDQVESRRQMMHERMRERLKKADGNGDGAISRAEADRSMPGVARHFDRIDTDGDGTITRDEMKAAREKMREMRQQREGENVDPADDSRPRRRRDN
jgi:hypothetical protein